MKQTVMVRILIIGLLAKTQMFLHNFMFLIDLLVEKLTGWYPNQLHIHAYLCLCLRDAVSLFIRINISDEEVFTLQQHFCGYSLFFSANPTVWTLGHVVPFHTKEMKSKYGMGLGLNSMEGREAKHST